MTLSGCKQTFNAELSGGEAVVLISDYGATETSDESRSQVAAIQRFTWAYSQTALHPEDRAWHRIAEELSVDAGLARGVETK